MDLLEAEILKKLPLNRQSRRLFHGRGHRFPGFDDLVIDWFCPAVLVTCYRERDKQWFRQLVSILQDMIPVISAVVLQERFLTGSPSRILFGELPAPLYAVEDDLQFALQLCHAQNIGYFPDMKKGRSYVRRIAAGKKVLNLFAYTCSFSVAALKGGAVHVDNLDMNKRALSLGRENHLANGLDLRNASFLSLELFRSFSRLAKLGPYDLVICDPPASQGKSFQAKRDWPKILSRLPSLLKPGGEVLLCLSAPELGRTFLKQMVAGHCPAARLLCEFSGGADFRDTDEDKGVGVLHYRI